MKFLFILVPKKLIYALSFEQLENREFESDVQKILIKLRANKNYLLKEFYEDGIFSLKLEQKNLWVINPFKSYLCINIYQNGKILKLSSRLIYKPYSKIFILSYIFFGFYIGVQTQNLFITIIITITSMHFISIVLKKTNFLFKQNPQKILDDIE